MGSKLAYQSKKIEIDTWLASGDAYKVEINEPWSSIERKLKPKPKIFEYNNSQDNKTGSSIRVIGHPPYRKEKPFTIEQIETYLLHRTFIGFTGERENPPEITLSVLGQTNKLSIGFPELKIKESKEGTVVINTSENITQPGTNKSIFVKMKGFYTWDDTDYGLDKNQLNTGLILSVKGIPYFKVDMGEFGSKNLRTVRPGENKCCLILECDTIQERMNISRSSLVDSIETNLLKKACSQIFSKIESSSEYLEFRRIQERRKSTHAAEQIDTKKRALESENQRWVIYQTDKDEKPIVLLREPENENDVLAILWKLEALNALPFKTFKTLGHAGNGPDLIAHFQEDESSHPDRYTSIEVENKFYNYKIHGHRPSQYPRIICWEIGKTPKLSINKTDKRYKYTAELDQFQVHIFALRQLSTLKVIPKKDFGKNEIIT
ncbi:MAG: hypothetical protein ACE5GU_08635 [Candidatus Scalinduaceae bacterium]